MKYVLDKITLPIYTPAHNEERDMYITFVEIILKSTLTMLEKARRIWSGPLSFELKSLAVQLFSCEVI